MHTFKDNAGREWRVDVNVATLIRVRKECGVDLLELKGVEVPQRLAQDPILMTEVAFQVATPANGDPPVDREGFLSAMAGDAIDQAYRALLFDLADFSARPKERENLRAIIKATDDVLDRTNDVIAERVKNLDPAGIVDAIAKEHPAPDSYGAISGAAQESSAPIPAPSPSGN